MIDILCAIKLYSKPYFMNKYSTNIIINENCPRKGSKVHKWIPTQREPIEHITYNKVVSQK